MALYDLILPVYGQSKITIQCLQSIRRHTADYRIIFIDNGSNDGDWESIYGELKRHNHISIRNSGNLGFVKAVNQGLCLLTAPFVVILNNDTQMAGGWADKLREALEPPETGAAGPRTTAKNSWQGVAPSWEGTRILARGSMLAFFCVMMKRHIIEKVGLLDETFGIGLGDDDDYCRRIYNAGYRLAFVGDVIIPHLHRTTFNALYTPAQIEIMQKRARRILRRKNEG